MHEIKNICPEKNLNSFSLFVGTGDCNANCGHCAGVPLRKYAPKEDGIVDESLIYKTIKNCYNAGARYLSLTSCGEPMLSPLSVTKTLNLVKKCENEEGMKFSPINIYSNGIRIGEDKKFCDKYLHLWHDCGLTTFYITVHNIDMKKNAEIYKVNSYPPLEEILSRIHNSGMKVRGNIVLSKKTVSNFEEFVSTVNHLEKIGIDSISSWPIRGQEDDKVDYINGPSEEELDKMENWINKNKNIKIEVKVLREKDHAKYEKKEKLTLFPNGILSNTWCNH